MFDHTQTSEMSWQPAAGAHANTARAEITALGFDLPKVSGINPSVGGGLSLPVSVSSIIADKFAAEAFLENLACLVAKNVLVCLQPEDFPDSYTPTDAWQLLCEAVADYLSKKKLPKRQLATCMHSHQIPLPAYCLIADSLFGRGRRYVFLDSLQMAAHRDPRIETRTSANWVFLWRQRNVGYPVIPVYGGFVRSACKLLADETATTIEPVASLLVPGGTAWTSVGLPITRFCTDAGSIDQQRLRDALRALVILADQLIDGSSWHNSLQQTDALTNRRLAVHISGLGDLLQTRGQHPGSLASLEWLTHLIRTIRSELLAASAKLAADRGALPALLDANPVGHWQEGAHRDRWQRYWRTAVSEAALRNRNLLVLSPASVLPSNGADSAAFTDLLPLLTLADAWSFACNAPTPGWTLAQFKDFHRRARAMIQASQHSSFVAARV